MTWSSLKLKIPLKYSGRRVHMYLYLVCKKEWSCVEFKKFKYSLTLFCQCECPLLNRICKENMKGIVWSYLCKLNIVSLWLLCVCVCLRCVFCRLIYYDTFNHIHVLKLDIYDICMKIDDRVDLVLKRQTLLWYK